MPDTPYRAIAESTYDWETWIDEKGVVRWVNPAVERLTGYTPAECRGMSGFPLVLVHEAERARIADVLESGGRGDAGNDIEFRVLHKDGSSRWVAISWQPLGTKGGEARGFRTSVRDIDERKNAEERLREAERRASRDAHERAELLATLSHELRSPLHVISGFGELIERFDLPDEARRYVHIVAEQSDAALRLVEDLLHFVSLGNAGVTLRNAPFDLAGLVEREVLASRPRMRDGVELRMRSALPASGTYLGDADRVRQIVANLLSNAARFTEDGRVDVLLSAERHGIAIEVRDTGIGMSRALLERVKDPFVQGAPSASSRGGVGLGLAIVDRLATTMGGTLTLASTPAYGTSALVVLPLVPTDPAPPVESSPKASVADAARITKLRVLVVDDSEPARELLSAMFGTLGITPDTAASGHEAIEKARATDYGLVLLDYHMPGLDGVEVARRIRADARATRPTLVLLTANVLAGAFVDPVHHGIDVALAKPLRLAAVSALVQRVEAGDPPHLPNVAAAASAGDHGLDRDVADELCTVRDAEGATLLARTLPRVSAYVARVVGTLREAIAVDAMTEDALARELHSMKGLVASVGAAEAARAASRVEHALRTRAPAHEVRARLDAFVHAYDVAERALVVIGRA